MSFISNAIVSFFLIGMVVITSSEVNASAIGCDNRQNHGPATDINAVSVELKLPYGYLCHEIRTDRNDIINQKAIYTSRASINGALVEKICNWSIDFVYYDEDGKEAMRDKGKTVSNCKQGASREVEIKRKLTEYTSTCAKLIVDGDPILTQCHKINN